jgi:hypothetical protein
MASIFATLKNDAWTPMSDHEKKAFLLSVEQ